ncbi:MAG: TraX family protein, partial [Bacillota bacterium]|nr:TraX family protein [Bacillota bacterium]
MMGREQRQFIQLVAALTMLIDHIGVLFFPTVAGFRVIGRLSFPLFAFGIAQGVSHTSDFRKYMGRLLLAAVLSQPIYQMAFGMSNLNPLFMLAWGALTLWFWQKEQRWAAVLLLLGAGLVDMSYDWYGVWTIFLFGFYGERESLCFYGQLVLNLLYGL